MIPETLSLITRLRFVLTWKLYPGIFQIFSSSLVDLTEYRRIKKDLIKYFWYSFRFRSSGLTLVFTRLEVRYFWINDLISDRDLRSSGCNSILFTTTEFLVDISIIPTEARNHRTQETVSLSLVLTRIAASGTS